MKSIIKVLEDHVASLEKVNKKLRKRNESQRAKCSQKLPTADMTSKSRTNAHIAEALLNPKRVPEVLRKRLLFGK